MGLCDVLRANSDQRNGQEADLALQVPLLRVSPGSFHPHSVLKAVRSPSTVRSVPRSKGITNYRDETMTPTSSNFTSHARKCKRQPASWSYDSWQKHEEDEVTEAVQSLTPMEKQQVMMKQFGEKGLQRPRVEFTVTGFHERLTMAVVEDGLPFVFTEGRGIRRVFAYSLPRDRRVSLQSHQTVGRQVGVLYDALRERLRAKIKVPPPKVSPQLRVNLDCT